MATAKKNTYGTKDHPTPGQRFYRQKPGILEHPSVMGSDPRFENLKVPHYRDRVNAESAEPTQWESGTSKQGG